MYWFKIYYSLYFRQEIFLYPLAKTAAAVVIAAAVFYRYYKILYFRLTVFSFHFLTDMQDILPVVFAGNRPFPI